MTLKVRKLDVVNFAVIKKKVEKLEGRCHEVRTNKSLS